MDEEPEALIDVEDVINEIDEQAVGNEEKVKNLKRKILGYLYENPEFNINDVNPFTKKLDGKTKEELEAILVNIEISKDSSVLFTLSRSVLKLVVTALDMFGFSFSFERLSKKTKLLKYIDAKIPNIVSNYADEVELLFFFMEEFELSEKEKNQTTAALENVPVVVNGGESSVEK